MAESLKRVALYARVSTADQTPENQLLDLRAYCARRGWQVIEPPYVDAGISGTTEDRPNLRRLMDDVRKRRMDIVLVWRFDRFARSTSHLVLTLEELRQRDIDFASYSENIDTATAQGKLVFTIFAAVAEFERSLIVDRVRSGLRRARKKGKRIGRPPIHPDQTARILAERGKGTIREIAARLAIPKSIVQRTLSLKPSQNVALSIDETHVAF